MITVSAFRNRGPAMGLTTVVTVRTNDARVRATNFSATTADVYGQLGNATEIKIAAMAVTNVTVVAIATNFGATTACAYQPLGSVTELITVATVVTKATVIQIE